MTAQDVPLSQEQALVEAAETALLNLSYMRAESATEWTALEEALAPYRPDCPCGMKNAPPMHHDSAPYFCGGTDAE